MIEISWFQYYLIFSTISFLFNEYLSYRQYHHLKTSSLPKTLEGIVTDEQFTKSVEYGTDKLAFRSLSSWMDFFFTNICFYFGINLMIWEKALVYAENVFKSYSSEFTQTLVFVFIHFVILFLWNLPFELYYDFVIEERHGFNRKTIKLYIMDEIKKTFLMFVILPPILKITIVVVRHGGNYFFFWMWIAYVCISFFFLNIYPVLIAPLFNKYEELHDKELKEKIDDLAKKLKYPLKKIYQMDESLRSGHGNAYLYGFGSNKRIVLFDTIFKLSHEQIVAVLGHELGHWMKYHTHISLFINYAHMLFMTFLFQMSFTLPGLYESFGFEKHRNNVAIGLFIFTGIYKPISFIIEIFCTLLSRKFEFQADQFAAKDLKLGKELKSGLIELNTSNQSAFSVDSWYEWFNYSHPHLLKRIEVIDKFAKID